MLWIMISVLAIGIAVDKNIIKPKTAMLIAFVGIIAGLIILLPNHESEIQKSIESNTSISYSDDVASA